MDPRPSHELELLTDARDRARKLAASLEAQSLGLEKSAGRFTAQTPRGREALARAIDSARRVLAGIERALARSQRDAGEQSNA